MKKMQSNENINVPAFLSKLWRMVNDPTTDHLISWSTAGKSFVIQNQAQFWYELLPVYYKHNNMSSFVRQLNMYGFHKLSPVDNGSVESDRDEIQFYHPNFQKDHPELLTNIKRKVTSAKATGSPTQNVLKADDLCKVLADVKQLKGRQNSVDSQLNAMKQENAVLWRELAMLRHKHIKQQQIVNKLIQFLVTIVQPASRLGGLGVKRHYPLMLSECPDKKSKISSSNSDGPTIHELDNTDRLSDELTAELEDAAPPASPQPEAEQDKSSELLEEVRKIEKDRMTPSDMMESPEYMEADMFLSDSELDNEGLDQLSNIETIDNLENQTENINDKVFLNPNASDTLLTDLISGSYNASALNGNKQLKKEESKEKESNDLAVARTYMRVNSAEDFHNHMETTQSELDQLKEILNGCNSLDANTLLGEYSLLQLFNDDSPDFINVISSYNDDQNKSDPLVSGSELAPYDSSQIDFSQLFDDETSGDGQTAEAIKKEVSSTINTPQITNDVPVFPLKSTAETNLKTK